MSDARRAELIDELRSLLDYVSEGVEFDNDGNIVPPRGLFIEGSLEPPAMARVGAILTELSTLWPRTTSDPTPK